MCGLPWESRASEVDQRLGVYFMEYNDITPRYAIATVYTRDEDYGNIFELIEVR